MILAMPPTTTSTKETGVAVEQSEAAPTSEAVPSPSALLSSSAKVPSSSAKVRFPLSEVSAGEVTQGYDRRHGLIVLIPVPSACIIRIEVDRRAHELGRDCPTSGQ